MPRSSEIGGAEYVNVLPSFMSSSICCALKMLTVVQPVSPNAQLFCRLLFISATWMSLEDTGPLPLNGSSRSNPLGPSTLKTCVWISPTSPSRPTLFSRSRLASGSSRFVRMSPMALLTGLFASRSPSSGSLTPKIWP